MASSKSLLELVQGLEKTLRSNKPINSVYQLLDKPAAYVMGGADNVAASVARAMSEEAKYTTKDAIRFGMQTYAALSVTNRALFGGSIARDRNGDFDIVGIPIL